jgi:hypothetical protein
MKQHAAILTEKEFCFFMWLFFCSIHPSAFRLSPEEAGTRPALEKRKRSALYFSPADSVNITENRERGGQSVPPSMSSLLPLPSTRAGGRGEQPCYTGEEAVEHVQRERDAPRATAPRPCLHLLLTVRRCSTSSSVLHGSERRGAAARAGGASACGPPASPPPPPPLWASDRRRRRRAVGAARP